MNDGASILSHDDVVVAAGFTRTVKLVCSIIPDPGLRLHHNQRRFIVVILLFTCPGDREDDSLLRES